MDTRFSSAVHILIMIAGSEQPLTSEAIANSVGTNPSYIRKVTGLLKKKGILDSRQGIHGFSLLIPPEALSLYTVYQAINESDEVHVFDLHQNLAETFREVEEKAERQLKQTTLADCMEKMRKEIDKRKTV